MATSRRNRYSRSTAGLNAIGFFTSAQPYTPVANYTEFVATSAYPNLVNGQMGIFLYPSLLTQSGLANLLPGDQFFIAQILDGAVKKSPVMTYDSLAASFTNPAPAATLQVRKTPYNAPVLQTVILGYNGVTGDINFPTTTPVSPVSYTLSARDTSPSTQPFPVQEGTIVHTRAATKIELALALASDFVNAVDYEDAADINFVTCNVKSSGALAPIAGSTLAFIQGSTTVAFDIAPVGLVVGDIIDYLTNSYKVVAINAAAIELDRPYQIASSIAAPGTVNIKTGIGDVGLEIAAIVEDTTFVLSYATLPLTIPPTVVIPWKQGSGAAWQMAEMEKDTAVMSGYVNANAQWPEDLGQPTFFVNGNSADTYTSYFLRFKNTTESMGHPNEPYSSFGYIIIGALTVGGPDTEISKILTNI